jgi:hypothetical protein
VEDDHGQAQREVDRGTKIRIITILLRRVVSEIKLKRTDTTLDLSQKAKRAGEKKRKGNWKRREGGEINIGSHAGLCTATSPAQCLGRALTAL